MGGGQAPGEDIGNGRAVAVLLAREGATVMVADRDLAAAEATAGRIYDEGGSASAAAVDATVAAQVHEVVEDVLARHGKLDILHNNVGAGQGLGGDADAEEITEDVFDRSFAVNVKSAWLSAKSTARAADQCRINRQHRFCGRHAQLADPRLQDRKARTSRAD